MPRLHADMDAALLAAVRHMRELERRIASLEAGHIPAQRLRIGSGRDGAVSVEFLTNATPTSNTNVTRIVVDPAAGGGIVLAHDGNTTGALGAIAHYPDVTLTGSGTGWSFEDANNIPQPMQYAVIYANPLLLLAIAGNSTSPGIALDAAGINITLAVSASTAPLLVIGWRFVA